MLHRQLCSVRSDLRDWSYKDPNISQSSDARSQKAHYDWRRGCAADRRTRGPGAGRAELWVEYEAASELGYLGRTSRDVRPRICGGMLLLGEAKREGPAQAELRPPTCAGVS
jgi:hypothetical protein